MPGACGPRLVPARGKGLEFEVVELLTQPNVPQHSCYHLQLYGWPDNGGYHAGQKHDLYTLVDPISPPPRFSRSGIRQRLVRDQLKPGGGAGYRPRVREAYYVARLSP